ncbi:hypothetical protein [Facilibium subflavum]|uniref:hypothetical protein n=1 Tax=Facilibium subflavum TaxID=2219058 RepID=UPI000E6467B6|nr:hypothetical protein [Facilibium subflavum]
MRCIFCNSPAVPNTNYCFFHQSSDQNNNQNFSQGGFNQLMPNNLTLNRKNSNESYMTQNNNQNFSQGGFNQLMSNNLTLNRKNSNESYMTQNNNQNFSQGGFNQLMSNNNESQITKIYDNIVNCNNFNHKDINVKVKFQNNEERNFCISDFMLLATTVDVVCNNFEKINYFIDDMNGGWEGWFQAEIFFWFQKYSKLHTQNIDREITTEYINKILDLVYTDKKLHEEFSYSLKNKIISPIKFIEMKCDYKNSTDDKFWTTVKNDKQKFHSQRVNDYVRLNPFKSQTKSLMPYIQNKVKKKLNHFGQNVIEITRQLLVMDNSTLEKISMDDFNGWTLKFNTNICVMFGWFKTDYD